MKRKCKVWKYYTPTESVTSNQENTCFPRIPAQEFYLIVQDLIRLRNRRKSSVRTFLLLDFLISSLHSPYSSHSSLSVSQTLFPCPYLLILVSTCGYSLLNFFPLIGCMAPALTSFRPLLVCKSQVLQAALSGPSSKHSLHAPSPFYLIFIVILFS